MHILDIFSLDFSWALTRGNALGLCGAVVLLSSFCNIIVRVITDAVCKKMYPSKKHKEIFPYYKNNWIKKRVLIGFNGVVSKFLIIFNIIETVFLSIVIIGTVAYLIFFNKVISDALRIVGLIELDINLLQMIFILLDLY